MGRAPNKPQADVEQRRDEESLAAAKVGLTAAHEPEQRAARHGDAERRKERLKGVLAVDPRDDHRQQHGDAEQAEQHPGGAKDDAEVHQCRAR